MHNSLKGKKVLVTGATGFIGGNLVQRLLKGKIDTSIIVRRKDNKFSRNKILRVFVGDITKPHTVNLPLHQIDIVFHIAAALPYHNLSEKEYWKVNVAGTENLIKSAIKNKIKKFIYVSTVGIYGDLAMDVSEETEPYPHGVYSISKLNAEKIVEKYKNKIETVIIRPTIAYGPGDTRPVFYRLFKLINKGFFLPVGKGNNYFHTIYIENLIDALILAATKKEAIGEDFIIGDDPCPKFIDIEKLIFKLVGKNFPNFYIPKHLAIIIFGIFQKSSQVSFISLEKRYKIDKAKGKLGFKPSVSLKKGFSKTFDWYREQKMI